MPKKTRPTFSAPSAKAGPQPAASQWVYRSDAATVAETAAIRTVAAPALPAPPAVAPRAPRHSGVLVNIGARLLFPVALVAGLVVDPLTACCRRRG